MFGALNRFISRLDSDPQGQDPGTRGAYGFQVLRNTNTELPIEPWFDFIIGVNGRNLVGIDPILCQKPMIDGPCRTVRTRASSRQKSATVLVRA